MARLNQIDDADQERTLERLSELEARVHQLEIYLGLEPSADAASAENHATLPVDQGTGWELKVGEYGLAWAGSIVLFLGIVFLMLFAHGKGYLAVSNILGYAIAAILFLLSRVWRNSIPHLARLMAAGTSLLLFYATLRLHFYSETPLLSSGPVVTLLIFVVSFQFYLARSFNSQLFGAAGVFLGLMTSLLAGQMWITHVLIAATAAISIFLSIRRAWLYLPAATVMLVYAAHLLWLLNNPIAGNSIKLLTNTPYNPAVLFLCAGILSYPVLFYRKTSSDPVTVVTSILNCFGFSFLMLIATIILWPESFAMMFLAASLFFILLAMLQWIRTGHQLPAAVFASFGFVALSISIARYEPLPTAFFWLSMQSLLVVSMALWFRSKTLVVVNSIMYAAILIAYLALSGGSVTINFTFAVVALISARVLNWQKERLTLQTGLLRNVYLSIAFILILYALYKAVPPEYVTLSWTSAAVCYFFLSYMLNNVKYRWMGTLAIMVTVIYLLVIDLPRLDIRYRIPAFLFLGMMTLIISLFYTKIRRLLMKTDGK